MGVATTNTWSCNLYHMEAAVRSLTTAQLIVLDDGLALGHERTCLRRLDAACARVDVSHDDEDRLLAASLSRQ